MCACVYVCVCVCTCVYVCVCVCGCVFGARFLCIVQLSYGASYSNNIMTPGVGQGERLRFRSFCSCQEKKHASFFRQLQQQHNDTWGGARGETKMQVILQLSGKETCQFLQASSHSLQIKNHACTAALTR